MGEADEGCGIGAQDRAHGGGAVEDGVGGGLVEEEGGEGLVEMLEERGGGGHDGGWVGDAGERGESSVGKYVCVW